MIRSGVPEVLLVRADGSRGGSRERVGLSRSNNTRALIDTRFTALGFFETAKQPQVRSSFQSETSPHFCDVWWFKSRTFQPHSLFDPLTTGL